MSFHINNGSHCDLPSLCLWQQATAPPPWSAAAPPSGQGLGLPAPPPPALRFQPLDHTALQGLMDFLRHEIRPAGADASPTTIVKLQSLLSAYGAPARDIQLCGEGLLQLLGNAYLHACSVGRSDRPIGEEMAFWRTWQTRPRAYLVAFYLPDTQGQTLQRLLAPLQQACCLPLTIQAHDELAWITIPCRASDGLPLHIYLYEGARATSPAPHADAGVAISALALLADEPPAAMELTHDPECHHPCSLPRSVVLTVLSYMHGRSDGDYNAVTALLRRCCQVWQQRLGDDWLPTLADELLQQYQWLQPHDNPWHRDLFALQCCLMLDDSLSDSGKNQLWRKLHSPPPRQQAAATHDDTCALWPAPPYLRLAHHLPSRCAEKPHSLFSLLFILRHNVHTLFHDAAAVRPASQDSYSLELDDGATVLRLIIPFTTLSASYLEMRDDLLVDDLRQRDPALHKLQQLLWAYFSMGDLTAPHFLLWSALRCLLRSGASAAANAAMLQCELARIPSLRPNPGALLLSSLCRDVAAGQSPLFAYWKAEKAQPQCKAQLFGTALDALMVTAKPSAPPPGAPPPTGALDALEQYCLHGSPTGYTPAAIAEEFDKALQDRSIGLAWLLRLSTARRRVAPAVTPDEHQLPLQTIEECGAKALTAYCRFVANDSDRHHTAHHLFTLLLLATRDNLDADALSAMRQRQPAAALLSDLIHPSFVSDVLKRDDSPFNETLVALSNYVGKLNPAHNDSALQLTLLLANKARPTPPLFRSVLILWGRLLQSCIECDTPWDASWQLTNLSDLHNALQTDRDERNRTELANSICLKADILLQKAAEQPAMLPVYLKLVIQASGSWRIPTKRLPALLKAFAALDHEHTDATGIIAMTDALQSLLLKRKASDSPHWREALYPKAIELLRHHAPQDRNLGRYATNLVKHGNHSLLSRTLDLKPIIQQSLLINTAKGLPLLVAAWQHSYLSDNDVKEMIDTFSAALTSSMVKALAQSDSFKEWLKQTSHDSLALGVLQPFFDRWALVYLQQHQGGDDAPKKYLIGPLLGLRQLWRNDELRKRVNDAIAVRDSPKP